MAMTYSKTGLELTESFEGCKLVAYADPLAKGKPTVGYGHTGPDVVVGETWTQEQCEEALASDISWAANVVNTLVKISITQSEFDALSDFIFNVGSGNFASSTMLKLLNDNEIAAAAAQFDLWDHASGKVVAGVLRRREAETNEFNLSPAA
jgi:lysozyme